MTEVELHVGTCCSTKSAGTTFIALASCVAASYFAPKPSVFKAMWLFNGLSLHKDWHYS